MQYKHKHYPDFGLSHPMQLRQLHNNYYMPTTWQPRPVSFPNYTRVCSQNLPGCIDPDYIQVAEVVALRVQLVAAGTALGPQPVRRRAVGSLHLLLSRHWKGQTWWETQRRSVTETKTFQPESREGSPTVSHAAFTLQLLFKSQNRGDCYITACHGVDSFWRTSPKSFKDWHKKQNKTKKNLNVYKQ